jgi:hypothetical protein
MCFEVLLKTMAFADMTETKNFFYRVNVCINLTSQRIGVKEQVCQQCSCFLDLVKLKPIVHKKVQVF